MGSFFMIMSASFSKLGWKGDNSRTRSKGPLGCKTKIEQLEVTSQGTTGSAVATLHFTSSFQRSFVTCQAKTRLLSRK